jgi:predicted RNA polymerase sigma factor
VSNSAHQREFERLLDEHGASLMSMLRRLCGRADIAEDVFQETALRVWRNLGRRRWLRNPRGWLMTIGYRAFVDAKARLPQQADVQDPADAAMPSPDTFAQRSEARSGSMRSGRLPWCWIGSRGGERHRATTQVHTQLGGGRLRPGCAPPAWESAYRSLAGIPRG